MDADEARWEKVGYQNAYSAQSGGPPETQSLSCLFSLSPQGTAQSPVELTLAQDTA